MSRQTWLVLSFVYLVVINVLDFITTRLMILREGYSIEANIFLLKWMQYVDSTYPIIVGKMIPLIIFAYALNLIVKKEPQHITKLIVVTNVMSLGLTVIVGASTYCLMI